jgi:hypothetical protein
MARGDHDFVAGEILTAANVDDYLMLQAKLEFATSAARDTALATRKREGTLTYQDDANSLTNYSGAAWSTIGPVNGALTTWTPVVTQSGAVAVTNTASTYTRTGRWVQGTFNLTATGAGTALTLITISLPVTAANSTSATYIGRGGITDISVPTVGNGDLVLNSSTTMKIQIPVAVSFTTAYTYLGTTYIVNALAAGDLISGNFAYEAAADA